jgi:hypothetical protein
VKPGQIQSSVDLPHKVIFGDRVAKTKLVEQLTLVTLQTARPSWIDLTENRVNTTESRNHSKKASPVSSTQGPLVYWLPCNQAHWATALLMPCQI